MDTSNMTLMEIFSNPDTMHSLSFGEKMTASAITMLMGLGITFTVLILIWIFIAIMGKVLGATSKPKKEAAPAAAPAAATAAPAKAEDPGEEFSSGTLKLKGCDEKTAAMIMAIVSDNTGIPLSELVFKSIKLVDEK